MSTAKKIEAQIRQVPAGKVITYATFSGMEPAERKAMAQSLCRLVQAGVLKRLGRGKFYKPEQSRFGELPLSEQEQLRLVLEDGYISGNEAFNRLGITTQLSGEVVIAKPGKPYSTKLGNLCIKYVKAYTNAKTENIELLMLLDALKQIKQVQDVSPDRVVTVVLKLVRQMDVQIVKELTTLGKSYPPRVRAILGAILEVSGRKRQSNILKKTLNPLSKYKSGIREVLPNLKEWNLQ